MSRDQFTSSENGTLCLGEGVEWIFFFKSSKRKIWKPFFWQRTNVSKSQLYLVKILKISLLFCENGLETQLASGYNLSSVDVFYLIVWSGSSYALIINILFLFFVFTWTVWMASSSLTQINTFRLPCLHLPPCVWIISGHLICWQDMGQLGAGGHYSFWLIR